MSSAVGASVTGQAQASTSSGGPSWNGRTSTLAAAGGRAAGGQRQGGVEVGRLDDPEAAELLLGLGEGAVGGDGLGAGGVDHRGHVGGVQAAGEHPGALGLELVVEAAGGLVGLLHLGLGGGAVAIDVVDGEEVLGHGVDPLLEAGPLPAFTTTTNGRSPGSTGSTENLRDSFPIGSAAMGTNERSKIEMTHDEIVQYLERSRTATMVTNGP